MVWASSCHFRDINFFNCWPPKRRSRSRSAIITITLFDGKSKNLQMSPTHFCVSSYRFRHIKKYIIFLLPPSSSRTESIILAVTHFDSKCQNLQMSPIMSYLKLKKIRPPKSRSSSRSGLFAITPFENKSQNLQMSATHFLHQLLPLNRYNKKAQPRSWHTAKWNKL